MSNMAEQEYLATLDQIRDLNISMKRISRERQKLFRKLEQIRAQHVIAIGSEKIEKGKAKYSNEKMREAELTLRLYDDSEYMVLQDRRLEIDEEGDDLRAEYNRLTDLKYLYMIKLGIPVELDESKDKYIELH